VVSAVFYLLQTGCQWRMLPRGAAQHRLWLLPGLDHRRGLAHVHDVLYRRSRELEGREESPTAAIIDRKSVKTGAEAREMVGFDAGKRVKGRKRAHTGPIRSLIPI